MHISRTHTAHGLPELVLIAGLLSAMAPMPLWGQAGESARNGGSKQTTVVTIGERYAAGSLHSTIFGRRYRDLWAMPVELEVLDLATFAGGLTPVRPGGSGQTKSLHFDGADGRRYIVRSVDKSLHVPADFEDTFFAEVMQDLKIHAFHPAAAVVVGPLMDAAGVLHADPKLVVVPDDPRLGAFREEFAGLIGMIEERPDEGPNETPGFAGSRRVVETATLLEHLEESPIHRVDAREYLKARLLDMWLGDRDRHVGQWRWARFDEGAGYLWRPIPRDRDEAFVANDGVAWWVAQRWLPRFTGFHDKYPNIGGLTENGWDLDRMLLGGLEPEVWDSVAFELRDALPDTVIEHAVREMPPEMYRASGEDLERALKARRDHLPEAGSAYYRLTAKEVDVYATDQSDVVVAEHLDDGELEVSIRHRNQDTGTVEPAPYYHRRFDERETREIRLYLRGGDDKVVVRGLQEKRITFRVIGGGDNDTLIDSTATGGRPTRFYDGRGENVFVTGAKTSVDTRDYERPRPTGVGPHEFYLDWGHAQFPAPILVANADHGLVLGGGIVRFDFGFRKAPFKHRLLLRGGISTTGRITFEYESYFAQISPALDASLRGSVSGVQPVRFYGFGNDTERGVADFHRVDQYRVVVDPSLIVGARSAVAVSLGPVFKFTDSTDDPNRIVVDTLYGAGRFSQLGAALGLTWRPGGRSIPRAREIVGSRRWKAGLKVDLRGTIYPAVLDVEDVFGEASGEVSSYLSAPVPTEPTLAVRVGAKKVWGENEIPFSDAAYLGGGGSMRGFASYRFAGDAAVFGNAELRFAFGEFYFLAPVQFGVFGLADAGRVSVDGESPGGWHTATGGGLWFAPLRIYTINVAVAYGEQTTITFRAGFTF